MTIDRIETSTSGYQALRIRAGGTTYYMVEARQKIGTDIDIPPNAPDHGVLITYCLPDLGSGEGIVREIDSHPYTKEHHDGDVLWQVGQVYVRFNEDGIGWNIAILSWTGTGFVVTVTTWPIMPVSFTQSGSGVAPTVQYQIDVGATMSGTVPFTAWVEHFGPHTISYTYQDMVPGTAGWEYLLADPGQHTRDVWQITDYLPLYGEVPPFHLDGHYTTGFAATFQQVGLPEGARWGVTVGGTRYTADKQSLKVDRLSGVVYYQYDASVTASVAGSYVCTSGCSGSVYKPATVRATYTFQPITVSSNRPPRISSLRANKASPQKLGSTITWTCTASDPENDPIQYRFQIQVVGGTWVTVQDWSKRNVFVWTPSGAGVYNVRCDIIDGRHLASSAYDDSRTVYSYTIL